MKIFNYNTNTFINIKNIKTGDKLRIEGGTFEVQELLESIEYKVINDGHSYNSLTRIYIEILPSKIEVMEDIKNKEFKEIFNRIRRRGELDEVIAKCNIYSVDNVIYSNIEFKYNEEYITIVTIDSINGYLLNTSENMEILVKLTKKAYTKYKKWFNNYGVALAPLEYVNI